MRTSFATAGIFCLALAAAGSACSSSEPTVWTKEASPKMLEAEKAASASLPIFWKRVESGDPHVESPAVKVGYPTAHGGTEYLWVAVERRAGDLVAGEIMNSPEDVASVHKGDHVEVDPAKIVDWAYLSRGRYFGQFTTRVLMQDADAQTRRDMGADLLAPTPIEPESN